MSFLSKLSPFLIIIVLILIETLCRDVSYSRQLDNVYNVNQNRTKYQITQPSPRWSYPQQTTPWPALGQHRRNYQSNADLSQNPSWVRPNNNQRNSNFNTGSQYGSVQEATFPAGEATDNELREFSENLLSKDVNNAARHVTVNVQSKTTSRSERDEAPLPLLSVSQEAFGIPSIEKMLNLHNNYVLESNTAEEYTAQEKNEENSLLEVVLNTPVMQYTRDFLTQKAKVGSNLQDFRDVLREIWFNMYARGGRRVGSSGFEHVFLAEIKKNQISGLHNWLYFNEEEKNNRANYLGYMKKIDLGNKGAILKYHFTFRGIDKPVGSMFIGTSPEFEMALYTTCFLLRADKVCPMKLNGNRFVIRTFTYRYKGKNLIGSAFPEI